MLYAAAIISAPIVKNISAIIITFFLPNFSIIGPVAIVAIAAPAYVNDTTKNFSYSVISGQVSLRKRMAPDTTPVS